MKKKNILALSLCGFISLSIIPVSMLLLNNDSNESLICNIEQSNKISIQKIQYSNATTYGRQKIHYTVNPKVNTDDLNYKLKYVDGSEVEPTIFEVDFKKEQDYIQLTCLTPFTKQIILTLYAISNESINASITIDFKEKISVNPSLVINENSPLSIENNIETTGGSIIVDKSVSNESITFSDIFVSNVKSKLKDRFESIHYSNPQTTTYNQTSAKFYGLEQNDCDYLFNDNFTYATFLESIYYEVEYSWIESDSDYETYVHEKMFLFDLIEEDFYEIFNGENPIFNYSCTINNQTYSKGLGILIDTLNITSITFANDAIIF